MTDSPGLRGIARNAVRPLVRTHRSAGSVVARSMSHDRAALLVSLGLLATVSCVTQVGAGAPPTQSGSGGHGAVVKPSSSSVEVIAVKTSTYGLLVIETTAGAVCSAKALLPSGGTVIAADFLTDRTVGDDGRAVWTYRTPVAGAGEGSGRYEVTCALEGQTAHASADFSIP